MILRFVRYGPNWRTLRMIDEGITRAKRRLGELSEQELEQLSGGEGTVIIVPVVVLQLLSPNATPDDPLELDLNH